MFALGLLSEVAGSVAAMLGGTGMSDRDGVEAVGGLDLHTRRGFLKRAALTGVAFAGVGVGDLLAPARSSAAWKLSGAVRGGSLTVGRNLEPHDLNPYGQGDNGSIGTRMQIFDQLVELGPGSVIGPGLAESWDVSHGGHVMVFNLREAKFSDGTPVTPTDVVFSLTNFANPKVNGGYAFLASAIKKVSVAGPRAVRVDLKHVDGGLLTNLAVFVASIIPEKAFKAKGATGFGKSPVGSGPFMLKSWTPGQAVDLVRNPHYWQKGRPYLHSVSLQFIPDDNNRILSLRSGQIDVADAIPFTQIKSLQGQSGVKVLVGPYTSIVGIWLNNKVKPLNDVNVRRALNYAVPKQAIIKAVFAGNAEVANSVIPKLKYWSPAVKAYPYDLNKAKKELAKSSVPHGFTLPLLIAGSDATQRQIAAIVAASWQQIGVKVTTQITDAANQNARLTSGAYSGYVMGPGAMTSDVAVDDEMSALELDSTAGLNSMFTNFVSPRATALVAKARGTTDEAVRHRTFAELQAYGLSEAPVVPIAFAPAVTGYRSNVHGLDVTIDQYWLLKDVWKH